MYNESTRTYTYTYTAAEGAETDAEDDVDDSFTLTASDAASGFHFHGLASLFNPQGAHTDTATVNVNINDGTPTITNDGNLDIDIPGYVGTLDTIVNRNNGHLYGTVVRDIANDDQGNPQHAISVVDLTSNTVIGDAIVTPGAAPAASQINQFDYFKTDTEVDQAGNVYVSTGDDKVIKMTPGGPYRGDLGQRRRNQPCDQPGRHQGLRQSL